MGKKQPLLGPGDAHVTETPLLFKRSGIIERSVTGEQPLFQPHQEDHGKFQALAAVQGHQGDPIRRGVLAVRITGESGGGQKTLQVALIVLFLILQRRIHQFLKVAASLLRLIGGFCDQFSDVPALLHHLLNQLGRSSVLHPQPQIIEQFAELQQPLG